MALKRYSYKISPLGTDESRENEVFQSFFKSETNLLYTVHSTLEKRPLYISKMQIGDLGEAIILGCNPKRMHVYLNENDTVVQEGVMRDRFEKVREKLGLSKSIAFYLPENEVDNILGIEKEYIQLIDAVTVFEPITSVRGLIKRVIE